MIPNQTSRLKTWLKRLGYSLLAILLLIGVIYALGWYSDWKEQRQLDEMLAELDRTEPGWRWKDFLPTPLQPGQENGALRFIEFGKTIDLQLFDLDGEQFTGFEPPNWLERPAAQTWFKQLLNKTRSEQQKVKELLRLKQSAIPLIHPKLSPSKAWNSNFEDREAFDNIYVCWMLIHFLNRAAANGDDADLAMATHRTQLAIMPAFRGGWHLRNFFVNHHQVIDGLQRTLALTQPNEPALSAFQNDCREWTKYLLISDDIWRDRALLFAFLEEAKDVDNQDAQMVFIDVEGQIASNPDRWDMYEGWRHFYTVKTPWEAVNNWIEDKKLFLPSRESVYRRECISNLRVQERLIKLVQLPIEAWVDELESILKWEDLRTDGQFSNFLFRFSVRNEVHGCIHRCLQMHTRIRAAEAAVACERYRIKNGDWPKSWEDVVPTFLEKIPLDAETHQKLIMKRLSNGLVIYGLGYDNTDHGGDVLSAVAVDGSVAVESDGRTMRQFPRENGFRLFDPAARRQPAPPKPKKTTSPQ